MITPQNNPIIADPSEPTFISLAQTNDSLIDTEIYSRFLYSCENTFRRSIFYRGYKDHLMRLGFTMDQDMAGLTSDMAAIELHHHFPTLKQASIMIIEHNLHTVGCVTSMQVLRELQYAHRNNQFAVKFMSKTNHQKHHADPTDFISLKQCIGNPFPFIEKYLDGMTLDICFNMLLQFKQEEQYGASYSPNMLKLRNDILDWSQNLQF